MPCFATPWITWKYNSGILICYHMLHKLFSRQHRFLPLARSSWSLPINHYTKFYDRTHHNNFQVLKQLIKLICRKKKNRGASPVVQWLGSCALLRQPGVTSSDPGRWASSTCQVHKFYVTSHKIEEDWQQLLYCGQYSSPKKKKGRERKRRRIKQELLGFKNLSYLIFLPPCVIIFLWGYFPQIRWS